MKNRLLFLASLSVASSLAWSFDVEIKGQNMSQALKQISPLVGLNLQASGQIANEVVYIRAKNAEPNAFLEQLTSATGLEWVKSGDIYTLTLTSNAKQKLLSRIQKCPRSSNFPGNRKPLRNWWSKANVRLHIRSQVGDRSPKLLSIFKKPTSTQFSDARQHHMDLAI